MARANRSGSISVRGLTELRKELAKLEDGPELTARLKDANVKTAQFVVTHAEPLLASYGRQAGKVSLRANRLASAARVSMSGLFPEGLEFGAHQNVRRRVNRNGNTYLRGGWNQFRPWKGNGEDTGYVIFPTIRNNTQQIVDLYEEEVGRITADAFPD